MTQPSASPSENAQRWFGRIPPIEAKAAFASLTVSVLLVAIKFAAYFLTGSNAIFSDALENVVNVIAAAFALYALALAHSPADEGHPYGHGKIEFFSAGLEGGMIVLAALVIAAKTISALLAGHFEVEELGWGLALTMLAMVINGITGFTLMRLGKRQNSVTLEADGHHLMSDAVTSVAALVALGIVRSFNAPLADPIMALLIAAYIAYVGTSLMRRSVAGLMDQQDVNDERLLHSLLQAHVGEQGRSPRICSYHKLRHRHAGRYHWVEFHLVLPAHYKLEHSHNIASAIEFEIEQALGEGNATAHLEPCEESDCQNCRLPLEDVPRAPRSNVHDGGPD